MSNFVASHFVARIMSGTLCILFVPFVLPNSFDLSICFVLSFIHDVAVHSFLGTVPDYDRTDTFFDSS